MKIDLGFIGKIIGYVVGLILLGALVSTGIFRLAGHGAARLPEAVGDFYGGMTGKEAKITVPGGLVKLGPVTFNMGGEKTLSIPESESGKGWRGVPSEGDQTGITWESVPPTSAVPSPAAPSTSVPSAPVAPSGPTCEVAAGVMKYSGEFVELGPVTAQEAGTRNITRWINDKYVEVMFPNGPGVVSALDSRVTCSGLAAATSPGGGVTVSTGPSSECLTARATLAGLQGSSNLEKVQATAQLVLATCTDTESIASANAALEIAVVEITRREEAIEAHQARVNSWRMLETGAAMLGTNSSYYDGVKAIILAAGGRVHLAKIEGLSPGIFKSQCGGGEICTLYVHPPADIAGEVGSITLKVELQALFNWGVGSGPSGILGRCTLPEVGMDYTLGGP